MKRSEFNVLPRRDPCEHGRYRVVLDSHRVTRPTHDGLKSAEGMRELPNRSPVGWGSPEYLLYVTLTGGRGRIPVDDHGSHAEDDRPVALTVQRPRSKPTTAALLVWRLDLRRATGLDVATGGRTYTMVFRGACCPIL